MRVFLALLFSIFLLTPSLADHAPADSTVRIRLTTSQGHIGGYGSGTYIGNNMILTAAHVVGYFKGQEPKQYNIQFGYRDQIYSAKLLWADADYDLAIIQFQENLDIVPVPVSCESTPVGTELRADGFPLWLGRVATWGKISSEAHANEQWKNINVVTMSVVMGQSGAGVSDLEGRLRGVLVGIPGMDGPGGEGEAFVLGMAFMVSGSAVCEAIYNHGSS